MSNTVDHTHSIIDVSHVSFSYDTHEVLRDITLSIHKGDYLALVGGNGSGKTTLVKIILGLLTPSVGSVMLFGEHSSKAVDRSRIGYVPQKATSFDNSFPATVFEVVMMGRYGKRGLFHRMKSQDYTRAEQALEQVNMLAFRTQLIGDLSGGQQQRVFIARALAGDPEILFLDEPTVGVEKDIKDEFYALLTQLNEEFNLTIVLITHDIETIATRAMHVACIDKTLYYHDSVDAYFKDTHVVLHPHT